VNSPSELLRWLGQVKPPVYLMGGFAEDIVLGDAPRDDRGDIDLLIPAEDWPQVRAALPGLAFECRLRGPGDEPLVYVAPQDGIDVELWLARPLADGYELVLPVEADAARFASLRLPEDTFTFDRGDDTRRLPTVSPAALALLRATSARSRGDATKRTRDLEVMRRLVEKFGLDEDAVEPPLIWLE